MWWVRESVHGDGSRLYVPLFLFEKEFEGSDRQEPAPAPFVGEMKNAAQFWADRVTKQFKETLVSCWMPAIELTM